VTKEELKPAEEEPQTKEMDSTKNEEIPTKSQHLSQTTEALALTLLGLSKSFDAKEEGNE